MVWPGVAMTDDGDDWYSYTISSFDEVRVIFSDNGSGQVPPQNQPGLLVSGEKWYKNGTFYDQNPDELSVTVHYYNYTGWTTPYLYYYDDSTNPVTWPGSAMTSEGDGWYRYTITGFGSARVIFSDNGSGQNPPQNEPGYLVSGEKWYRNGTWTEARPDDIVVYFYKPSGWGTPNIYYYLTPSDTGPAWPGVAMTAVSGGWYSARITKYSSAKVLFNDGTNQIPPQNQPGLDAEGVMWYKDGVWCDAETDTDSDDLPDYMELMLGTSVNGTDSDSDGLPDGLEFYTLNTDPTLADSDSNGVSDANEDADSDGLSNLREVQLGTNPVEEDSDEDGLTDGNEVNTLLTDPLDEDTDADGAGDGWEVEHLFDPLVYNSSFNVSVSLGFRDDEVAPSVSATLEGEQAESLAIEQMEYNDFYLNDTVGAVGSAYEFSVSGSINSAVISFEFDSALLNDADFDPVIYYFDEDEMDLIEVPTTVTGNVAQAQVTHFSKYVLLDRNSYDDAFNWVEVSSLYKTYGTDFDSIETIFLVDNSSSMIASDTDFLRFSMTNTIAQALPSGSKMSVLVLCNDAFNAVSNGMTGQLHFWTASEMNTYLSLLQSDSGGNINISYAVQCAINEFSQSTSSNRIMKHIVILSDGKSQEALLHQSDLPSSIPDDVFLSFIDFGSDEELTRQNMRYISALKIIQYYFNHNYQGFLSDYNHVLYLGPDIDNDGLPDAYEGGTILYNGTTLFTALGDPDTDGDGLLDGQELVLELSDPVNGQCKVYGKIYSDPTEVDTDSDGILDCADSAPFTKGLMGGAVGELSIVSAPGHSFLLYKSYVTEMFHFQGLQDVYKRNDGVFESIPGAKNYYIEPNHYISIGCFADSKDEAIFDAFYDAIIVSINGTPATSGGIRCNNEFFLYQNNNEDNQRPNCALTVEIDEADLESLVNYWNNNSYYSVLNHNCTSVAIESWMLVSDFNFVLSSPLPILLQNQLWIGGGREVNLEEIIPYVL